MDYMSTTRLPQSVSGIDADSLSLDQWHRKLFISGGHFPLKIFWVAPPLFMMGYPVSFSNVVSLCVLLCKRWQF